MEGYHMHRLQGLTFGHFREAIMQPTIGRYTKEDTKKIVVPFI